jgi:hypothetical protein
MAYSSHQVMHMSLNEITTIAFSVLTLLFAVYGFILMVRVASRVMKALDVYIENNRKGPPSSRE